MRKRTKLLCNICAISALCLALFLIISGGWSLIKGNETPVEQSVVEETSENGTSNAERSTETVADGDAVSDNAEAENKDASSAESSSKTDVTGTEEETEPWQDIVLEFTGDIMLSDYVQQSYDSYGIDGVLSEGLQTEFANADMLMVNEEFPFGTTGAAAADKQYTFLIPPNYCSLFTQMGIDVVTLANNHTLDFGTSALEETFSTLDEAGILYAGAGENLERASALQVLNVRGTRIGILAASRVIPDTSWNVENGGPGVFTTYDETLLDAAIDEAKNNCEYLLVYVHWGIERNTTPEEYQTYLAHQYIEHGADLVVGSHPHVLQGIDWYQGKPIFYSLGNFMFYQSIESTAVLKVTLNEALEPTFQLIPASAENSKTSEVEGEKKSEILNQIETLSYSTVIDDEGIVTEQAE